jgi:hypothetical protein
MRVNYTIRSGAIIIYFLKKVHMYTHRILQCLYLKYKDWVRWLTPVILDNEEKIQRIAVPGQPRQKVSKTPISINTPVMVAHACIPATQKSYIDAP